MIDIHISRNERRSPDFPPQKKTVKLLIWNDTRKYHALRACVYIYIREHKLLRFIELPTTPETRKQLRLITKIQLLNSNTRLHC